MKKLKVLMVVIMTFLTIYAIVFRVSEMNVEYIEAKYVIQPGDTLWIIAKENVSEHQSIQEYIYNLKKVNNITSDLEVGQVITIFKKEKVIYPSDQTEIDNF